MHTILLKLAINEDCLPSFFPSSQHPYCFLHPVCLNIIHLCYSTNICLCVPLSTYHRMAVYVRRLKKKLRKKTMHITIDLYTYM